MLLFVIIGVVLIAAWIYDGSSTLPINIGVGALSLYGLYYSFSSLSGGWAFILGTVCFIISCIGLYNMYDIIIKGNTSKEETRKAIKDALDKGHTIEDIAAGRHRED